MNALVLDNWHRALAGDAGARRLWVAETSDAWNWHPNGIIATGTAAEWSTLRYTGEGAVDSVGGFSVGVTVRGTAEAAGLSFGDYKDFLAELGGGATCRVELQVEPVSGAWLLSVNNSRTHRYWWDAAVRSASDIVHGQLTLKVKRLSAVCFENLTFTPLQPECRLSVIMTCYRFLQRLRVSLLNWSHQDLRPGEYEILVVNPQSPDGTHEYLQMAGTICPEVSIREIPVGRELATNKGAMINAAFNASRGEWIWVTDADCVFPPDCARRVLQQVEGHRNRLFFCERRHLSQQHAGAVIVGRMSLLQDFAVLSSAPETRAGEAAPYGYTQLIHRSTYERVLYREHLNHFAHTDEMFVADCRRRGIAPRRIEELHCLHLVHPFAWWGTETFL